MRRILATLSLVLAGATLAPSAEGQPRVADESPEARAAVMFHEGVELYRAGEFVQAAVLFQRAHELDPDPVLLFNLARAREAANEHAAAAATYERYLREAPEVEDRAAIEALVRNLRERAEQRAALSEEAPAPPRRPSAAPWVVLAIGGATAGAGVGVGAMARARNADAESAESHASAVARRGEARQLQRTANALLGVGAAMAVAGLVWGLIDRRRRDPGDVEVAVGFGIVGVRVTLQ